MPDDNSLSESINDIVNHCYPSNSSDNTWNIKPGMVSNKGTVNNKTEMIFNPQ
jgi:hypothetical protein